MNHDESSQINTRRNFKFSDEWCSCGKPMDLDCNSSFSHENQYYVDISNILARYIHTLYLYHIYKKTTISFNENNNIIDFKYNDNNYIIEFKHHFIIPIECYISKNTIISDTYIFDEHTIKLFEESHKLYITNMHSALDKFKEFSNKYTMNELIFSAYFENFTNIFLFKLTNDFIHLTINNNIYRIPINNNIPIEKCDSNECSDNIMYINIKKNNIELFSKTF